MTLLIPVITTVLFGAIIKNEGVYKLFGKNLLWEETYIGMGVGLAAGLLIWRPFAPFLAALCGILWAYAGAEGTSKYIRRIGVGLVIALVGIFVNLFAGFVILSMWGATSLGYGIPCPGDSGSVIGKFWYNKTHSEFLANISTRATVGLLYGLALLPLLK